jgi:hypothetical protein
MGEVLNWQGFHLQFSLSAIPICSILLIKLLIKLLKYDADIYRYNLFSDKVIILAPGLICMYLVYRTKQKI